MLSYWQKNYFNQPVDLAIIGAGINGMLTAIYLKQKYPDFSVAIFEKGLISDGATLRNAGFACFGSVSELEDDLQFSNLETVLSVLKNRYEGLLRLKTLLGENAIKFKPVGGFELFTSDELHQYDNCMNRIDFWNQELKNCIGLNEVFTEYTQGADSLGLSSTSKLLHNQYEGSIHSNALVQALYKQTLAYQIPVYYGFELEKYVPESTCIDLIFKNDFQIKSQQLLFCTNGYLPQLHGLRDVKPARGQVLVTQPIDGLKLSGVFHHQFGYNYFRELDGRILLGGGRFLDFEGETTTEHELNEKIQDYLEGLLLTHIAPNADIKIDMRWSGIMAMGQNKKPIIEKLEERVYYAGRMGGMGVALGAQSAWDAAQLIASEI